MVRAGQRRIEGLPLFDGTFTSSEGVTGRLGPPTSDADLALVRLDAAGIAAEGRPLSDSRISGRYRGLVIVTEGPRPGLSPTNAPASEAPYGPPAIQVSSEEGPWLESLAADRTTLQLVVDAGRTRADASNVVAQVAGRDATLAPLIVMTPRSGWWQCAAERGGGLACWLEAIRTVRAARPPRTLRFIASSGHELGHLGLESFLARQPDLVARAAAWIHLGANIGAAGGRMRVQASDDAIEQLALTAMTRASIDPPSRVPRGTGTCWRGAEHSRCRWSLRVHPWIEPVLPPSGRPVASVRRSAGRFEIRDRRSRPDRTPGREGRLGRSSNSRVEANL